MSDSVPDIKSAVVRVITNKPVRKTPYQVKGVLMRQYPDEDIIPMLNGSYRKRYLYPRVQVKILNEEIYLIGINEGIDSVLSLNDKLQSLDFGNITFDIEDCNVEVSKNQFIPSEEMIRYQFLTPWVALNHMTGEKYKSLKNQDRPSYLNKLLGQNIIFIAKEVGVELVDDILTKVKVSSLLPKPVDDKKWGAFMGEFKTNFILPNYIGLGNGVTRGFGTLNGFLNSKIASSDETEMEDFYESESVDSISASDVPTPKRKRHAGQKKKKFNVKKKYKNSRNKKKRTFSNHSQNKQKRHRNSSNFKSQRFKHVISEGYHIEDTNGNSKKNDDINQNDDERFNTEKHHKQQHKF